MVYPRLILGLKHPANEQPDSSMPKNAKNMKINFYREAHLSFYLWRCPIKQTKKQTNSFNQSPLWMLKKSCSFVWRLQDLPKKGQNFLLEPKKRSFDWVVFQRFCAGWTTWKQAYSHLNTKLCEGFNKGLTRLQKAFCLAYSSKGYTELLLLV